MNTVTEYCTSVVGQEPTLPGGPEKHVICWCDFQVTKMSSVLKYLICFQQLRQNEQNHLLDLKETEYIAFCCFILITAHLVFGRIDLRLNLQSDSDLLSPILHILCLSFVTLCTLKMPYVLSLSVDGTLSNIFTQEVPQLQNYSELQRH